MSDKKKKFKKIFIPLLIVVIISAAIGSFFAIKNSKKKSNPTNPEVSNVSITSIESAALSDALNYKYSTQYNGNYSFKSIVDIEFDKDLSDDKKEKIYYSLCGAKDKNSLVGYLLSKKKTASKNEIICLSNGKYTKSVNSETKARGLYYGNDNKSFVYVEKNDGSVVIEDINYENEFDVSLSGYWIQNSIGSQTNVLYLREKYFYGTVSDSYFIVTYLYKMI